MEPEPAPSVTTTQSKLRGLVAEGRLTDYPVAVRTAREVVGGGFADNEKHPNTWTVYFLIDGQWALVSSARGLRREWSSLDKLEKWLRSMGFRFFWVRNDIDPVDLVDPVEGGALRRPGLK